MVESESGLSDLMDDLDLEESYDTGYEKDIEVDNIDGFYHRNVAFIYDKVRSLLRIPAGQTVLSFRSGIFFSSS